MVAAAVLTRTAACDLQDHCWRCCPLLIGGEVSYFLRQLPNAVAAQSYEPVCRLPEQRAPYCCVCCRFEGHKRVARASGWCFLGGDGAAGSYHGNFWALAVILVTVIERYIYGATVVNMVGQTTHILLSGAGVWTVERLQCAQGEIISARVRRLSLQRPRSGGGRRLVRIRIYGSRAPRGSDRLRSPFVRFCRCAFLCAFCGYFYLPIDGFACEM